MEMGLIIDCPVQYTKVAGSTNMVNLAGSLSENEIKSPSAGTTITNVWVSISGHETFDEKEDEYTSGEISLKYRFHAVQEQEGSSLLEGEVLLLLERVKASGP
jgi:hypothetical protein